MLFVFWLLFSDSDLIFVFDSYFYIWLDYLIPHYRIYHTHMLSRFSDTLPVYTYIFTHQVMHTRADADSDSDSRWFMSRRKKNTSWFWCDCFGWYLSTYLYATAIFRFRIYFYLPLSSTMGLTTGFSALFKKKSCKQELDRPTFHTDTDFRTAIDWKPTALDSDCDWDTSLFHYHYNTATSILFLTPIIHIVLLLLWYYIIHTIHVRLFPTDTRVNQLDPVPETSKASRFDPIPTWSSDVDVRHGDLIESIDTIDSDLIDETRLDWLWYFSIFIFHYQDTDSYTFSSILLPLSISTS